MHIFSRDNITNAFEIYDCREYLLTNFVIYYTNYRIVSKDEKYITELAYVAYDVIEAGIDTSIYDCQLEFLDANINSEMVERLGASRNKHGSYRPPRRTEMVGC